jgi:two-component system sensor histidine kinase YesM
MITSKLNQLINFAKSKLLVKLVLIYSTIMLIPLLITIQFVTDSINSKLLELEVSKQKEITVNMKTYLNDQYKKINQIIYLLYYSTNDVAAPVDMLIQTDQEEGGFNNSIRNRITSYLNNISLSMDGISDVLLLDNYSTPNVFSTSTRSISRSYNFANFAQLNPTDRRTFIFPVQSPDYILGVHDSVITHVGNLYDLTDLPSRIPVGKYIINLSSAAIMKHYNQLAGSNGADFYILQEQGMVLFSNKPREIGTIHPFSEQIIGSTNKEIKLDNETYILNKSRLSQKGLYIVMQVPKEEIVKDTQGLINNILTVFLIGVILVLVLAFLFSSYVAFKIKKLHIAMRSVEKGNFNVLIHSTSTDEFGQLTASFNRMCSRLEEYVDKVYIAEINSKSARLSSLQSAINPHFLYNTIESIRMKAIEEHSKEIPHMLYILGKLFHWRISSEHSIITVEEELESINWYLELLQFRFQNNLEIKLIIEESIYDYGIPKLLLQPIIENAFNHGLFHKDQQSVLLIRGRKSDERLIFDIIDNGQGIEPVQLQNLLLKIEGNLESKSSDHIGLTNVMQRIQVMFGMEYGVEVTSKHHYWTKVSISIPAKSRQEMEDHVQSFHY